jgi:hypothetical protein
VNRPGFIGDSLRYVLRDFLRPLVQIYLAADAAVAGAGQHHDGRCGSYSVSVGLELPLLAG